MQCSPEQGVTNGSTICSSSSSSSVLTWYTADVHTPAVLKRSQAFMHNVGLGVVADTAVQSLFLGLQHGRQARVGQALHYHALHQSPTIIVLDVAHPLQVSITHCIMYDALHHCSP